MRFAGAAMPGGVLALLLVLSGCAADQRIAANEAYGRQALASGHAAEATREYRAALARARANGDGAAIATAGTDLAIAELADNKPDQALAEARALQAELGGRTPPPTLGLVVATALYRQGNLPAAEAAAREVAAGPDQAVALRGRFLLGLIADARHDTAGLLAASLVLAGHNDPLSVADVTELKARLDLARGEAASAQHWALASARLRTRLEDARGLARCEGLAADAALAAGQRAQAARLYLRAGRDEAAVGDGARARVWLGQAKSLAADPAVSRAAAQALAGLQA
ncbi:MAG: hypothetical protein KGK10_11865 [Rhodospirillales bacterium]|nr:hypothetical protein [Rhodospirillales bacterium]